MSGTEEQTTATATIDIGAILNWGDVFSAATVSGIEYALGEKPSGSKAMTAVAISSISRIITQNFTTLSSLGGNITEKESKDAFVVALINGLVAMGMRKSVAKQVAIGVAGDVLSDRTLYMLGLDSKKSLFQSK